MENRSIAKNLVYLRKKRGYSQAELSEMTNVTVRTIQRIENEEVNPHLKTVKLLAAALDVDVDDLLVLDDPKEEIIQKKWLLLLHGTPMLGLSIPLCNILIPLFLWIHKREDNPVYDRHGRAIVNFHITMTIMFALALVALLTVQGYGFFFFIAIVPYTIIVTLINIITALNSQKCYYPLAIPFLRSKKSTASKVIAILCISCLFDLAGSDPVSSQSISQPETTDPQFKGFAAEVDSLRKAHHIPGLAVAIVKDQKLAWSTGYGSSHFDTGDGNKYKSVTADTPFWIASVTKTFLGLLFLQLDEQGAINLEDQMNEMSGWDDYCNWLAQSTIVFGQNLQCDQPITIRNVLNHTVNGIPGTAFLYNPIMYSRLSRYLEYINGNPISAAEKGQNKMARLIQENILGPAGLNRTMSSQWQRKIAEVFFTWLKGMSIKTENIFAV